MAIDVIIGAELTRRALFTGAASGAAAPFALPDGTADYIPVSEKAQAGGVATLDAGRRIYVDQIPPGFATLDAAGHIYESQLPQVVAQRDDLVFNVRDYGATGDGVTDDLAGIQAAISAATAHGGGTVWFPVGVYSVSGPLGDTTTGLTSITLAGAGSQIATIRAASNAPILTGLWYSCTVVNLVLDGNGQGSPCISAHFDKSHLERLLLLNWTTFGINVNDGTFSDDGGLLNVILRCNIQQNTGTGIYTGFRFYDSWIVDNNVGASYADLSLEGGPVRVLGNHLDGSPTYNIELRGNKRILISNNILEGSRKQSIVYRMPAWLTSDKPQIQIIGNTFSNGGKLAQNTYPAISIVGLSSAARVEGFSVTGNTFACDDVGAGWTYIIEAQFARTIAAVGNQWKEGHMATQPCRFLTCAATEVVGNQADNAVKTT